MGRVAWPLYIFVFLASFLALWWPNIWPKMGFPELFEKTVGSVHFIPGIYPYGVIFLTPIHFRVPSLIFGPLVAKYLAENGISGTFWKNYWLNSVFSWRIPTCVAHDCKIEIFIGHFWMRWVVIRAGLYCPHLWAQLVGSDNGLLPFWCEVITWTNADLLSIGSIETNFSESWMKIQQSSVKKHTCKCCLQKCSHFISGINVLTHCSLVTPYDDTDLNPHWPMI